MYIILSIFAVFAVLCISEIGWRKHWLNNEIGRKFVHITVGSFVAFWPFYMSWGTIRWLSLVFIIVVIISDRLKIFRAINSVQRPTFGEICFAAVVGLLTFVTQSKGIYAAALLQMSIADGMAAVIGIRYGTENKYHIFGHTKSIVGTSTFFVLSFGILIGYALYSAVGLPIAIAFVAAAIASGVENVSVAGLDNLIVPLFIGVVLTQI